MKYEYPFDFAFFGNIYFIKVKIYYTLNVLHFLTITRNSFFFSQQLVNQAIEKNIIPRTKLSKIVTIKR